MSENNLCSMGDVFAQDRSLKCRLNALVKYFQVLNIDQGWILIRNNGRRIEKSKPMIAGEKYSPVGTPAPRLFMVLIT